MGDLKILPNDNILQVIADQAVDAPDSIVRRVKTDIFHFMFGFQIF